MCINDGAQIVQNLRETCTVRHLLKRLLLRSQQGFGLRCGIRCLFCCARGGAAFGFVVRRFRETLHCDWPSRLTGPLWQTVILGAKLARAMAEHRPVTIWMAMRSFGRIGLNPRESIFSVTSRPVRPVASR